MINVTLGGCVWFADPTTQIVYEGTDQTKGKPFSFLSASELEIVQREIRFPSQQETE